MEPEFAPEYSAKERLHRLAVVLPLALGTAAAFQWWFIPLFRQFADNAHCRTLFGIPGEVVLFYGLFVGFPILLALTVCAMTIRSSLKTIQTRRYPPLGEKVFRRTKVRTGWRAVAIASAPIVLVLYLFGMAAWGYGPATELIKKGQVNPHERKCVSNLGASLNTSVNTDSSSRLPRR